LVTSAAVAAFLMLFLCCVVLAACICTMIGSIASASAWLMAITLSHRHERAVQAERGLMKWACGMCKTVMTDPVCTPCAHHFCNLCLLTAFDANVADAGKAGAAVPGRRTFRARKQAKRCPRCNAELTEFMKSCQVNHAMAAEISGVREKAVAAAARLTAERERLQRVLQAAPTSPDLASGAAVQGCFVRVWWPAEEKWFTGIVKAHKEGTQFTVSYLDGDVQEHDFSQEKLEWLISIDAGANPLPYRSPVDWLSISIPLSVQRPVTHSFELDRSGTCPCAL
jgi:RING-type zinc-finger